MGDWQGHADAEELRMLQVIAGFAADQALVHGAYGAAFHGYYLCAVRKATAYGVRIKLTVSGRQTAFAAYVPTGREMMICTNAFDES